MAAKPSEIAGLDEALAALRADELVVYPTETYYALGADPFSEDAMERLFALKGRDPEKPVALIAADAPMAFALARSTPESAHALADAFWPGPLTLVLAPRDGIPGALIGPTGGVGVRVSPNPVARALSAGLGRPITATSANLSGQPPASTLSAARAALGDRVRVYLEGGTLHASAPSTVVACEDEGFRIIRAGAIVERELVAALSTGALK